MPRGSSSGWNWNPATNPLSHFWKKNSWKVGKIHLKVGKMCVFFFFLGIYHRAIVGIVTIQMSTGHLRCLELPQFLVIITISSFVLRTKARLDADISSAFISTSAWSTSENQWLELEPKEPPSRKERSSEPNLRDFGEPSRQFSHRIHVDWHVISHRITCMFTYIQLVLLLISTIHVGQYGK